MKVCFFGTYESNYPPNSTLIKALRKYGVDVVECHSPVWEKKEDKTSVGVFGKLKFAFDLVAAYARLIPQLYKIKKDVDCIVVGYIGHLDMFVARLVAPRKKIVFNVLLSLYETVVIDRKMTNNFLAKKFLRWLDKTSCRLANYAILDTEFNADYFRKEYGLKNIVAMYYGADEEYYKPLKQQKKSDKIQVLYYSVFTPLNGAKYVIESAKYLKDNPKIEYVIVGKGQTYKEDREIAEREGLSNITFIDWIPFKELPQAIANSDISLCGHFDASDKALRVMPNKVYQIIAVGRPIVLNNGPAIKAADFRHMENCMMVEPGNSKAIADVVLTLAKDKELREKLSKNARDHYVRMFSYENIANRLKKIIELN